MTRELEISKREREIAEEVRRLNDEKDEICRRKMWHCYACGRKTQVSKITIIQDHWYVRPSSCSEGDYWNTSDEVFVPCPKCNTINRICDSFVQIRSVSPIKTVNESKTYNLLSTLRRYVKEVLNYYPRENQIPTHTEIEELRIRRKNNVR